MIEFLCSIKFHYLKCKNCLNSRFISVIYVQNSSLHHNHNKPFRTYATCVRRKAETFNFTTVSECKCGKKNVTSYLEEAIKYVMIAVLGDDDIRR